MNATQAKCDGELVGYEFELDADFALVGKVNIEYTILRPAGYSFMAGGRNPLDYEADVCWEVSEIVSLDMVGPRGQYNLPINVVELCQNPHAEKWLKAE